MSIEVQSYMNMIWAEHICSYSKFALHSTAKSLANISIVLDFKLG